MKRVNFAGWLAGMMLLLVMLAWGGGNVYAASWNGNGTEASPYLISSTGDLVELAAAVNNGTLGSVYLRQTADIVFPSGASHTAIGIPQKMFNGTYDGAGFVISGINIIKSSSNYQGLFGYIGANGKVKNVNLINSTIKGKQYVGGIAGDSFGTIQNCSSVANQITGTDSVGGIAGRINNGAAVESSYSSSLVNGGVRTAGVVGYVLNSRMQQCWSTGNVSAGGNYAGGICGYGYNSTIEDCYNTGRINGGGTYSGGITGGNQYGTIKNCCNYGGVAGSITGGVIGEDNRGANGTVSNNYFLQSDTINSGLNGIATLQDSNGAQAQSGTAMQTDVFAYNLNTTGGSAANSGNWSRNPELNQGFPVMANENNRSICQVICMNNDASHACAYSSFRGVVALPDKPIQTGYLFGGWYTQRNGAGVALTENSIIDTNLTVYAYWFANPGYLPAFEMLKAEIKSDHPQGLRFKTRLYKNTLFMDKKIKKFGTIILPSALIPAGQSLTMETMPINADSRPNSKIVDIPALNIYNQNDDYLIFTGVLINIPADHTEAEITARAYVTYIDNSNAEVTIYSNPVTGSLSTAPTGL